jgi:dTMP kinase
MSLKRGLFITFEGVEGCGKTTQIRKLASALRKMKYPVITTFEPGDSKIGKKLRKFLTEKRRNSLSPEAEVFLFLADRAQHVHKLILPALRKKKIILCDRYVDSTMAYQAFGRGLSARFLQGMNQFAVSGLCPNLTFFLDVSVPLGLQRIKNRKKNNQLDKESIKFYTRVQKGYHYLAKRNSRIVILDASQSVESLRAIILEKVKGLLRKM